LTPPLPAADLRALAERCERAQGWMLDGEIAKALGQVFIGTSWPTYTASLDAALTLVPEGWHVGLWVDPDGTARVRMGNGERVIYAGSPQANCATPALALCAAALRALAAAGSEGR